MTADSYWKRQYDTLKEYTVQLHAAISVACHSNTPESAKRNRVGRDHPLWSPVLEDVHRAVDREIALRKHLCKHPGTVRSAGARRNSARTPSEATTNTTSPAAPAGARRRRP